MKRVLKELKITRIAAVDFPCQEGALMTIMKRDPEAPPINPRIEELKKSVLYLGRKLALRSKLSEIRKRMDAA